MREVEAIATLEDHWQPVPLYHVARGLRWQVRAVLHRWTHPGWPGKTYQKPVAQKRYRLRVFGPLPGRPDQLGEFAVNRLATAYAWRRCLCMSLGGATVPGGSRSGQTGSRV